MDPRASGVAFARAALAGNPSDGYGGAVLAVALPFWRAKVDAVPAVELSVDPPSRLVRTAAERFERELAPGTLRSALTWKTTVPRGVGLGGSSALVVATIRSLCDLHRVDLGPDRLAELALAVETEDLGIVAGLQDRVAQAYGGVTFMDFGGGGVGDEPPASAGAHGAYERLDPALLPPLLIAWRPEAAGHSGDVHAALRERHRRGEGVVERTMVQLAAAAHGARAALMSGDTERLCDCIDASFDLRRGMLELDDRCVEMVEAARSSGAGANYTGSGGAIVAVTRRGNSLAAVEDALRRAGCEARQYPRAYPDGA